jgi:hypothetical protein
MRNFTLQILSVGHSDILSMNALEGNLRSTFCIFLLIWMTYGQFDDQQIKKYFNP